MPRTYDIIAFHNAGFSTPALTDQKLLVAGNTPAFCTGIQKLVQRWLLEFLTERGSMGFHLSERGTDFLPQFRNMQYAAENVVYSEFAFAAIAVAENLAADYTADTPNDERLASAELTNLVIQPGALRLYVQLTAASGESTSFVTPISALPNLAAL